MRLAYLFAASSVLLFACAPASSDDRASTSASHMESDPGTPSAVIFQQAQRQFSRGLASDGRVTFTKLDELSVIVDHGLVSSQHVLEQGTYECSFGGTTNTGRFQSSELSLIDASGEKTVLIPARPREQSDYELIQGSGLTGSLGPYLFVTETEYFFGCGAAHPSHSKTGFVWNAKTKQKVSFEAPAAALEQAKSALANKGFPGEEPKLAELVPHFDAEGHFSVGWRFEKAASHAEADDQGNDYSVSVTIDSKTLDAPLPPELEALKDPPAAVSAYIAATHDTDGNPMLGWSAD